MDIKSKMREGLRKFFPELKPVGYDDQDNPCYAIEDIAKALDLTSMRLRRHLTTWTPNASYRQTNFTGFNE